MREPIVSIARCSPADDADRVAQGVAEALDLLGGMEAIICPGDTALIKPNLIAARSYETGVTSNPHVVCALVREAKRCDARRVIVGDGAAVGYDTTEVLEVTGMRRMAEEAGAEVVDFKRGEFRTVIVPGGRIHRRLRVCAPLLDAQVVINVPVMKTHDALPVTLGLKNMKGVIHENDKKRFHRWGLNESLVDLNRVALAELTVLDGTVAHEGPGPTRGTPVNLGLLIASTDTVAADVVAATVMGFDPHDIDHIRLCAEAGFGEGNLDAIEVVGETVENVRRPFKRVDYDFSSFQDCGITVIEKGACSGCRHMVRTLLETAQIKGSLELLIGRTIVFGQTVKPPQDAENVLLIGSCMKHARQCGTYIAGCPPHGADVVETLKDTALR